MNRQTTLRRAVLGCIVAIAVATSAGCAEIESVTAEPYELRASATKTLFDGFAAVYTEGRDDGTDEDEDEADDNY